MFTRQGKVKKKMTAVDYLNKLSIFLFIFAFYHKAETNMCLNLGTLGICKQLIIKEVFF